MCSSLRQISGYCSSGLDFSERLGDSTFQGGWLTPWQHDCVKCIRVSTITHYRLVRCRFCWSITWSCKKYIYYNSQMKLLCFPSRQGWGHRRIPRGLLQQHILRNQQQETTCQRLSYYLKWPSYPAVLRKMFNVSALLLDDALSKCVVTEVVLFSIVAFKTPAFHKVV